MPTVFAPPELLSAYSYAVDGSDPAEPLQPGWHLRIFGGLGGSFPLAPFAVFRILSNPNEPHSLHCTDQRGRPLPSTDVGQAGGVLDITPIFADTDTYRTMRIEVVPYPQGSLDEVQLLDQQGRVLAARRKPPFLFSAPRLAKVRTRGSAQEVQIVSRMVAEDNVLSERAPPDAADLLGLPAPGRHRWYAGVHDRGAALERVLRGAPRFLNPMDQPDGPLDPVESQAEVARVEALLGAARFGDGLEQQVLALVQDPPEPWLQVEQRPLNAKQLAGIPRLGGIQLSAIDPGLARFLGFATRVDPVPNPSTGEGWSALAIVGLFAVDPGLATRLPLLADWLASPHPSEPRLIELIAEAARDIASVNLKTDLGRVFADARSRGLLVRAAVAVTAPVPPSLPPSLPAPEVYEHRWQASAGDAPSHRYRATFTFADAPLTALVAVAAELDGEWTGRHAPLPVPGQQPPVRSAPRIFGHETEAVTRVRSTLGSGSSAALAPAGLVADQDLPSEQGQIRYRFRASDFFGRFGEAAGGKVSPPPRPAPPPPVLRYALDLHEPEALPNAGKASPGVLRVTLAVPEPYPTEPFEGVDDSKFREAILVPRLDQLAAGSLAIRTATITVNGDAQDVDVTAPGLYDMTFDLPRLKPQDREDVTVSAIFKDTANTSSAKATLTFGVGDRRPLQAIESGIALYWTSAAGPSPDVQLRLTWRGARNGLYRVYSTDQQGLGLTAADLKEHVAGAPPSRGRIAEVGCNKVLAGEPVDKSAFRLLVDRVAADASGVALLDTTLSRSLETVQFLRIVPLSAEGAEAPFDTCGIVPVAVPESRRPPLPRLDASVDARTGRVTLEVRAEGFDGIALRRDEPGLFEPGPGKVEAPTFRVLRAVGAVADPIYAREAAKGELVHDPAGDVAGSSAVVFKGDAKDTNGGKGLEPFVRYTYWAEVQLPPERRLPAGVKPIDKGFSTPDAANSAPYPRPPSLPSASQTVVRIPKDPPPAPTPADIHIEAAAAPGAATDITIQITNPPRAQAAAIGRYHLAIWTQWDNGPLTPADNANGQNLDGVWPELTDDPITTTVKPATAGGVAIGRLSLRLAFVDPAGRTGRLTNVDASHRVFSVWLTPPLR
jgi:hypothetical protein